jgi:hypothetical protein
VPPNCSLQRDVDNARLRILLDPLLAILRADPGLLGSAERYVEGHIEPLVHPYRARLNLGGDGDTAFDIPRPHRSAEAIISVVGAGYGIRDVLEG